MFSINYLRPERIPPSVLFPGKRPVFHNAPDCKAPGPIGGLVSGIARAMLLRHFTAAEVPGADTARLKQLKR